MFDIIDRIRNHQDRHHHQSKSRSYHVHIQDNQAHYSVATRSHKFPDEILS